jgi:hypothetical protein
MAEWKYRIERIDLHLEAESDAQLEKVLQEYGQQGWELVQVLHGKEAPDNPKCRLIFKTERPPSPMSKMGKTRNGLLTGWPVDPGLLGGRH